MRQGASVRISPLGQSALAIAATLVAVLASTGLLISVESSAAAKELSSGASGARTQPTPGSSPTPSGPPREFGTSPAATPRPTDPASFTAGTPHGMRPPQSAISSSSAGVGPLYTTSPSYMSYQSGGPVLTNPRVYVVLWGSWWSNANNSDGVDTAGHASTYIDAFTRGIGGTSWFNTLAQYCQFVPLGSTDCHTAIPQNMIQNSPSGVYSGLWPDASNPQTPVT